MLKTNETFWEHEKTAPLMALNYDFLKEGKQDDAFYERFEKWVGMVGAVADEADYMKKVNYEDADESKKAELARVVEADAIRTFFNDDNRKKLVRFLTVLRTQFKDYHQGLGYVASFLLLVLDEHKAFAILEQLNAREKYIPGYWAAEAIALATDAHVFNELLRQQDPEVADFLAAKYVFPNTFCQKWFAGLCVHVLPFEDLCDFLEMFFEHGYTALIQFGITLTHLQREQLMQQKTSSDVFALLRLDATRVERSTAKAIVAATRAALATKPFAGKDFAALRRVAFETHIEPRLRNASEAKVADSDEDESWEDEDGIGCAVCDVGMPELYCTVCSKALCGVCQDEKHDKSHNTEEFDWDNELHMKQPDKNDSGDEDNVDATTAPESNSDTDAATTATTTPQKSSADATTMSAAQQQPAFSTPQSAKATPQSTPMTVSANQSSNFATPSTPKPSNKTENNNDKNEDDVDKLSSKIEKMKL